MGEAPEKIWAEPDGDDIIVHKDPEIMWTGYLHEYTRTDIHKAALAEKDAEIARLRAQLDGSATTPADAARVPEIVLIGGNHLALHIGDNPPHSRTDPLVALEHYSAGMQYDLWCCWAAIMNARDGAVADGGIND